MDLELIKKLIKCFKESDLKSLHLKSEAFDISMEAKESLPKFSEEIYPLKELSEIEIENIVYAPMVGSFYSSAAPNEKPFVNVGDKVKKGDTLCIIEAMKVMNEVKAKRDGKIKEVKVKDGDPIEFGKSLFVME